MTSNEESTEAMKMIGLKQFCAALGFLWLFSNDCAAQIFPTQNQPSDEQFLLAPRPLTRLLREGEKAIAEGRFSEGIGSLHSLLEPSEEDDLRGQDFFVEAGQRGLYSKSVKGEAVRILGMLPPEGRRTLEVQFGVTAQRELAEAIKAKDFEAISDIARKYMHTEAGYDAIVLSSRYKMTQGYPLAAAGLLKELLTYPAARERYGPKLALAAARAWMLANNPQSAQMTMKLAARDFPSESVELGGRQIPLELNTNWLPILESSLKQSESFISQAASESWTMTGGSPERNAISEAGLPLTSERWEQRTYSSLALEGDSLEKQMDAESKKGVVLMPKAELRIVSDLVLAKKTDGSLVAIDFHTGLNRWACFSNNIPAPLTNELRERRSREGAVSRELQNRVWGSSAFGKFSCDDQRVYLVNDPNSMKLSTGRNFATGNFDQSNYLEAASFAGEGAILWRVGEVDGTDEPALADTFFLGPPLPYAGDLFLIAETRGEVFLIVLDAETGKFRWRQQLAQSNTLPLQFDKERKSHALTPTIAEGVILCPTGVGAVVAVDLLSRSLRWGMTYASNRLISNNIFQRRGAFGETTEYSPLERRWQEPGMIAQDGVVVISPPESDELLCRDILTGAARMNTQKRGSNRYVAGLRDGIVIVVGERSASAIQLGSGKTVWVCEFPRDLTLAGKGLWQADSMLLPLSDNIVILVDTATGKVLDESKTDLQLGNLFAYKKQLLSVAPSSIAVFYVRDQLEDEVNERLAKDPNDLWALNQQSQVAMAKDDLDAALASLTKAFSIDPQSADTRHLMVELLLRGLSKDFGKFEAVAQQYRQVFDIGPKRFSFLQQLALGKIRAGQYLDAFKKLLELVPDPQTGYSIQIGRPRELSLDSNYEVDSDAWIATSLARCFVAATQSEQAKMTQLVEAELASVKDSMLSLQREKLRFLRWLPDASSAVFELSAKLLGGEEQTSGEALLHPQLFSAEPSMKLAASELLRQPVMTDVRFGSFRVQDTPTISKLDALDRPLAKETDRQPGDANGNDHSESESEFEWNSGQVELTATNGNDYQFGAIVEVISERFGRPDLSIRLSGERINLRNGNGVDCGVLEYPRASSDVTPDAFAKGTIRGGLLLIETSSEIAAFDIYRAANPEVDALLWRHSLLSPSASPTQEFGIPEVSTLNTALGFTLSRRQIPGKRQAIVGPLTPMGVVVQVGTQIKLLDALTGKVVWQRDGYDDRVQLTARGLEVAVVNPSAGRTEIYDCRDGTELRQVEAGEAVGSWRTWFTHDGLLVDYSETRTVPPGLPKLRVWDAFSGKALKELALPNGTRAANCEGRFVMLVQPNSTLHYFDLAREQLGYASFKSTGITGVESISLEKFEDRLVLLTNTSRTRENKTEQFEVNGGIIAVDTRSGELCWDRAGKIRQLMFPKSQPRNSPFMVALNLDGSESNRNRNQAWATFALVDLRDGKLAYSGSSLALGINNFFSMQLIPSAQTIKMSLGGRRFNFKVTDTPRAPQPILQFGAKSLSPAQSSSQE